MRPESEKYIQEFITQKISAIRQNSSSREYLHILNLLASEAMLKRSGSSTFGMAWRQGIASLASSPVFFEVTDLYRLIADIQNSAVWKDAQLSSSDVDRTLELMQTILQSSISQETPKTHEESPAAEKSSTAKSMTQLGSAPAASEPVEEAADVESKGAIPLVPTKSGEAISFTLIVDGMDKEQRTTFISKFAGQPVPEDASIYKKTLQLGGRTIELVIKDRVNSPNGTILAFAFDDHASFEHIKQRYSNALGRFATRMVGGTPRPYTLVGCKADSKDSAGAVTSAEARKLAEEFQIDYFETSENDDASITAAFQNLAGRCLVEHDILLEMRKPQRNQNYLSLDKYRTSVRDYERNFDEALQHIDKSQKIDQQLSESIRLFRGAAWKQAMLEVEKLSSPDEKIAFLKGIQKMAVFSHKVEPTSFLRFSKTPLEKQVDTLQDSIGNLLKGYEKQKGEEQQASHTEPTEKSAPKQ
jgi:hypothetical protein